MSLTPASAAFFIQVAATGWFEVGLAPIRKTTSASMTSLTWFDTAPEPTPSSRAATDEAWHRRVQWSTLFWPKPMRTSFWKRYASLFDPFAEPKPASAYRSSSRIFLKPEAANSRASSQVASRNTADQFDASTLKSVVFLTLFFLIKGFVSRCGCAA